MAHFDASRDWVILIPPHEFHARKAAEDLARYIGLLAKLCGIRGLGKNNASALKIPILMDATQTAPSSDTPVIVLNSENAGPEQNGFSWRTGALRVEIFGESGRGLCNGIYSFLSALGISWPAPGQEKLPEAPIKMPQGSHHLSSPEFPLAMDRTFEPSGHGEIESASWRRFSASGEKAVKGILKKCEAFIIWAARKRYDALILPLKTFARRSHKRKLKQLSSFASQYGIALEAGGRDISSFVPRRYFFFHRDFFRMEEGRRKKNCHFCPTNPGALKLIRKEGVKLFRAAREISIFHLWPDKGKETIWCSCPSCRAFTPQEQNRITVNAAADVLADINPDAIITYSEKSGEPGLLSGAIDNSGAISRGNIMLRKNLRRMERIPFEAAILPAAKNYKELSEQGM